MEVSRGLEQFKTTNFDPIFADGLHQTIRKSYDDDNSRIIQQSRYLYCSAYVYVRLYKHSVVPTASPESLVDSVKVEDVVEIERNYGTNVKFEVTEVSKEGIRGSGVFVPCPEIQKVSVIRERLVRTGLLVVLGVAVVVALEMNADCGIFEWGEECDD